MAKRPLFVPDPAGYLVEERIVEFEWFSGFAASQKRRCVESLHRSAATDLGTSSVLEVSTKSANPLGVRLSAFSLSIEIDAQPNPILLEAAFQGSKVFGARGPFTHLYSVRSGRDVKRYMRQFSGDHLTGFRFDGRDWELTPKTAFYDWLYVRALGALAERDGEIDDALVGFDAFTDIEFNPDKSINCQARSCALYVALLKNRSLRTATTDPTEFIAMLRRHGYSDGAHSRSRA
ncbi:MAG: hypothetical protein F4X11_03775 [Acidobacteria bacterium]|nr:hypothetical protein [Acidobacteriota bacterium]